MFEHLGINKQKDTTQEKRITGFNEAIFILDVGKMKYYPMEFPLSPDPNSTSTKTLNKKFPRRERPPHPVTGEPPPMTEQEKLHEEKYAKDFESSDQPVILPGDGGLGFFLHQYTRRKVKGYDIPVGSKNKIIIFLKYAWAFAKNGGVSILMLGGIIYIVVRAIAWCCGLCCSSRDDDDDDEDDDEEDDEEEEDEKTKKKETKKDR